MQRNETIYQLTRVEDRRIITRGDVANITLIGSQRIETDFDFSDTNSILSIGTIPAGARVSHVNLRIAAAFNNNIQILVGTALLEAFLLVYADTNPAETGDFLFFPDKLIEASSEFFIKFSAQASQGSGTIIIYYT